MFYKTVGLLFLNTNEEEEKGKSESEKTAKAT